MQALRDSARVAELVDALDLGSSGISCRGSSPLSRTSKNIKFPTNYKVFS